MPCRLVSLLPAVLAFAATVATGPPALAAGYWTCRDGAWVAVDAPRHPRPLKSCGPTPSLPNSEAACIAARGRWARAGISPRPICHLPTRDAGRVCGDTQECESVCLANPTAEQKKRLAARLVVSITGRCAAQRPGGYGCIHIVAKGQTKGMICVD